MEKQGGSIGITPLQGTYIIGVANAFFALVALSVISCFGRRSIYIVGHLSMAIVLFVCGLASYHSWNMLSFVSIIVFIGVFHLSQGSINWLYTPEVCVDAATGLALAGQFINLTIISFTFEYMI